MSSQGSPTLDLDVRSRRIERFVALSGIALAVVGPWLLQQHLWRLAVIGIAAGAIAAYGYWRAGWIGTRHRLSRVVWLADGRWFLTDHHGGCIEAIVRSDSRRGPGCVWLRWDGTNRTYSLLLGPGDLAPGELRRLLVRLAIDRVIPPVTPFVAIGVDADTTATAACGAGGLGRLSPARLFRFASAQPVHDRKERRALPVRHP